MRGPAPRGPALDAPGLLAPALLAEVWRGGIREAVIRGHAVVLDGAGEVVSSAGDPEITVPLRSTVKPIQAIPFVEEAIDRLGCSSDELAVACASHQGEPLHVATVGRLLARVGLDEGALSCGPQPPSSSAAAWELAAAGERPGPIHNNCSGKHAGMLAACAVAGYPLDGYAHPDHPLQRRIASLLTQLAGVDIAGAPRGVDGCGLPTHGVPLRALALTFGAAARQAGAFARCQAAMAEHPFLVAGSGRFDTALLEVAGAALTAKIGGAAVWAATARSGELSVALKLEAGTGDQVAPVAIALLQQVGLLSQQLPTALHSHASPPLRNWAQDVVGETRVVLALEAP